MEDRESWAQQPCISALVDDDGAQSLACQPVSVSLGNALDQAVQSQSPQFVADSALLDLVGRANTP